MAGQVDCEESDEDDQDEQSLGRRQKEPEHHVHWKLFFNPKEAGF